MAEDPVDADISGKGEPVTSDPFGALADEGAELQKSVSVGKDEPAAETTVEPAKALSICQQGPCKHHSVVRFPSGIAAGQTLIVVDKHYCERGVIFPETSIGGRMLIGTVSTLPTDCSSWTPMTEEEHEQQDSRRVVAQEKLATKLAAEAAQQAPEEDPFGKDPDFDSESVKGEEVALPNLEDPFTSKGDR